MSCCSSSLPPARPRRKPRWKAHLGKGCTCDKWHPARNFLRRTLNHVGLVPVESKKFVHDATPRKVRLYGLCRFAYCTTPLIYFPDLATINNETDKIKKKIWPGACRSCRFAFSP